MKYNEKEAERVVANAKRTIDIVKAIQKGLTANEIVREIGCNYSVATYYIKLLTNKS